MKQIFALTLWLSLVPLIFGEIEIDCTIEHIESKYCCNFYLKTILKDDQVEVRTYHGRSSYDKDVKQVAFDYSSVYSVPKAIFQMFRNLEKLDVIGQEVQEIQPRTFIRATKLRDLNLSNNYIKKLLGKSFEGAIDLENLFLDYNTIQEIHWATFIGLSSLKQLNLGNNEIKSLHHNIFRQNRNLKILNLENNQLEVLPDNLLIENIKLEEIFLNGNKLSFISNVMFSHLMNLDKLVMYSNNCTNQNYYQANLEFEMLESDLRSCSIDSHMI